MLTREELMRHEAAGITTAAFPKTIRLGGVDCAASYLHEPGDPKDGVTVTVPIYALNQVSEERCEWLVPGMLKEKVLALAEDAAPAAALAAACRCPTYADAFVAADDVRRSGSLRRRAAAGTCASSTQLDVKRADFKQEQLPAHLLHELPRRRRTRPPARHGPQPRGAEGRARRAGAFGLPGAGRR